MLEQIEFRSPVIKQVEVLSALCQQTTEQSPVNTTHSETSKTATVINITSVIELEEV